MYGVIIFHFFLTNVWDFLSHQTQSHLKWEKLNKAQKKGECGSFMVLFEPKVGNKEF